MELASTCCVRSCSTLAIAKLYPETKPDCVQSSGEHPCDKSALCKIKRLRIEDIADALT